MIRRLLVANRAEIAVRVMRSAAEMGIATVAVAPADDQASLHLRRADDTRTLAGHGPAAYLDARQLLAVAAEAVCDAIHPGYGFLSENAAFAQSCADAGMVFVGPTPQQLQLLGNKAEARALAARCDVPVLAGTASAVTLEQARAFQSALGRPVMVKALSGGGGRGIRLVPTGADLEAAFQRCQSEALRSFGDERLYVEQALVRARHIEVQLVGDGTGHVVHLGERDCSLQRRNQKLVEIAPSPALAPALRERLIGAAVRMAQEIRLLNVCTFEFLVDAGPDPSGFYFLEGNPRLQVEHTVTEELWGVDLVHTQLRIAAGATLAELQLDRLTPRRGFTLQARINMERMLPDGAPVMEQGTITGFEPSSGPGVRVDTCGYRGYANNAAFDSLLAKLVVSSTDADFGVVLRKARRALAEFVVRGIPTNLSFLRALLAYPEVEANQLATRLVDDHVAELLAAAAALGEADAPHEQPGQDGSDPSAAVGHTPSWPEGVVATTSFLNGSVVHVLVEPGQTIVAGQTIAIVEAMKMEHVIAAGSGGLVREVLVAAGSAIRVGQAVATIAVDGLGGPARLEAAAIDLDVIRPDLAELRERQQGVLDPQREDAVARRHAKGYRTVRENVDALFDQDTFVEYGSLVVAGQRRRRSLEDLIRTTPGDGVVVGFGSVNGATFDPKIAQTLVIAFDETVLAGTMGEMGREKIKHVLSVAQKARRPVVLFAEGGGGRAGDTDLRMGITGWSMDVSSYYQLGQMSGLAPLVGITNGRCFAANAGMLACCDVIIATEGANLGVGGPSMIEGGRLGQFTPEQIGPMDVQCANGVVDILVADEPEAVATAKKYLAYFQGALPTWDAPDARALRFVVPENRLRAYEVRQAIDLIADIGSVLELRSKFGIGMVTALVRVEGRALGVMANNPLHLGGAIDSEAADKASRFMRLCEAFGLPILMLCDTPGVMVGPEAEKSATVRKMGRMFVTGANLTVPFFTIVLRKAYGIGGILMAGGWFKAPRFVVSWPTGEFGGMNIEGNVKLAHGAELEAIADPQQRQQRFDSLVQEMHASGRALSVATHNEVDNVIDPADSRRWIGSALAAYGGRAPGSDKTVPFVDPW